MTMLLIGPNRPATRHRAVTDMFPKTSHAGVARAAPEAKIRIRILAGVDIERKSTGLRALHLK